MSSDRPLIDTKGLWKSYHLEEGILGLARRLTRGASSSRVWALEGIDLEVGPGESLGIVGRNGAGKSTLLKVLAGVTFPTHGAVEVRGRVFPMIELSAGLNRELTGRENVFVLAAIMGLSRKETVGRLPSIRDFCELGRFFDVPVRKYSSGMLARLGFAVAVNVEPDVLLVDEVLAVGDPAFRQKCYGRILTLMRSGVTLLFVSHAFRQVGRLCERTLWLDEGRPVMLGRSEEVLLEYMNDLQRRVGEGRDAGGRPGVCSESAHVRRVTLTRAGEGASPPRTDEDAVVTVEYSLDHDVPDAYFLVEVLSQDNLPVASFTSRDAAPYRLEKGDGVVRCRLARLPLLPGVYLLNAGIGRRRSNETLTRGYLQAPVTVECASYDILESRSGYFRIDAEWEPFR